MAILEKSLLFVFLLQTVYGLVRIEPLVDTNVGLIRGLRADDGDYSMFLGIPFGQVDRNNPFGASTSYPAFDDVFEAYDDSAICPQIEEFNHTYTGILDCLHLNVFVPHTATSRNRLPVLVWIHGGGFRIGFGNRFLYGPSFLVRHDIILVTLNYRLGPYGFMCLDTPEIPGNQGLKDQLLGLRWIKNNIDAFGGDSSKITLSGDSAGSIAVDLHLLSKNEKLFDKVILQSGTSLSPIGNTPIKKAPQILAEYLGFETNDTDKALQFLTKTDPSLVIAATSALGIGGSFRSCIEKEFDNVESFITENWITAAIPKARNMPILIGCNSNEWLSIHAFGDDDHFKNSNTVQRYLSLDFDVNNKDFDGMFDTVYHFYFGDEPMSANLKQSVIDFESDFSFIHPTYRSINRYIENGAGNIFLYVFSYVGKRNFIRHKLGISDDDGGAVHADEIGYLFDISYMKNQPLTYEDQRAVDRMTTMWANFVKYGEPTPQPMDLLPVQWLPITKKSSMYYMDIGSELMVGARPFHYRASFWDLFYEKNKHLQQGPWRQG